jgi:dihydrofolate reductase
MLKVSLIVACDLHYGIGKLNQLPWTIKEDMKFFTETTQNSCVVMGRNTWDSIPEKFRGLKNRLNIIVSSKLNENDISLQNNTKSECYLAKTIEQVFDIYKLFGSNKEIFIIGGVSLYEYFLKKPYLILLYVL